MAYLRETIIDEKVFCLLFFDGLNTAVSVVFPWSTCPMVPMLACALTGWAAWLLNWQAHAINLFRKDTV